MDADAQGLGNLNSDANILVAGYEDRIGDGAVACQFDEVGDDQGVDALLTAGEGEDAEA